MSNIKINEFLNNIQKTAPNDFYLYREYDPILNKTIYGYQMDIINYSSRYACYITNMIEYTTTPFMSDYVIYPHFALKNSKYRRNILHNISKIIKNCRKKAYFMITLQSDDVLAGHQIVVMYSKVDKCAYIFDSSGMAKQYTDAYTFLNMLFGDLNEIPHSTMLQEYEEIGLNPSEIQGYCLIWCVLFLECCCRFNISPKFIPSVISDYARSPMTLLIISRAYTWKIMMEVA